MAQKDAMQGVVPAQPNYGDDAPTIFKLPWHVREEIYCLAFGGHVVLPRPDLPHQPSLGARNEMGRLFGKVKNSTQHQAFNGAQDVYTRFLDAVLTAIYGNGWNEASARTAAELQSKNLLSWIISCKRAYEESLTTVYQTNIFDIRLVAMAAGVPIDNLFEIIDPNRPRPFSSNPSDAQNPALYCRPPQISAQHLDEIRAIHIPSRPLENALKILRLTPPQCLKAVKHIVIACADRNQAHVPGSEVRHHIPHGDAWRGIWGEVATKFPALESIEVNICGFRYPIGWRNEVLNPIIRAAKHMGRLPVAENDEDVAVQNEANKGKLVINPKCRVKKFDVFVPWAEETVISHNAAAAHTFGFRLIADQCTNGAIVAKQATRSFDEVDMGWED